MISIITSNYTFPIGLLGLLMTMALVLSENAFASSSGSRVQSLELIGYLPPPLSYIKNNNNGDMIVRLIELLVLTALGNGLSGT